MLPKMDTMILVSGDGDYTDLLEYARSQGVKSEVIAFGKTMSSKLTAAADYITDMDKESAKFLIGGSGQLGQANRKRSPVVKPVEDTLPDATHETT